nr:RusA family crossover junction endodeoxyribonuclease [Tardibacter chloracetimidivorans]
MVSTASRGAKLWRQAVELAARHARAKPFTGAVEIRMAFRFAVPKTRPEYLGQPHTAKPDGDNLAKAVMDVLEAVGLLENDCRVSRLTVEKRWAETAGVGVEVIDCAWNAVERGQERVDSVDGCRSPPEWLCASEGRLRAK